MLRHWQINYRDEDSIMQTFNVKKMSLRDAQDAAREMFPECEIVLIVEGDLVVEE